MLSTQSFQNERANEANKLTINALKKCEIENFWRAKVAWTFWCVDIFTNSFYWSCDLITLITCSINNLLYFSIVVVITICFCHNFLIGQCNRYLMQNQDFGRRNFKNWILARKNRFRGFQWRWFQLFGSRNEIRSE